MTSPAVVPAEPPRELVYRRRFSPARALRAVWGAREVVRSLAERSLRSRYKQALLGATWALITPLTLMVAFTLLFDRVADIDTQGVPYALFSYLGVVPWTFFSGSTSASASSITGNVSLINKIPCPREVFPLSVVLIAMVDAVLACVALVALFVIHTTMPALTSVWVPVLLVVLVAFTVGISLIVSIVTVYVRDLRTALPLALQFGLFVTPVAYGFDVIPEQYRGIYSFLNPLGPVIDGIRRTVLFGEAPQLGYLALGALGATMTLTFGYWLFKRLEPGIADVA